MAYRKKKYHVIPKRELRGGKLEELINRVRWAGENFIVKERGEPLVKILPVTGREEVVNQRKRRSAF